MSNLWPHLSYEAAKATYNTLHLWTQIIGKIKLGKMPWINHSWHVTLLVTPRGLTTGPMHEGAKYFQIDFDFCAHTLVINTSENEGSEIQLQDMSVAEFYGTVMQALKQFGIEAKINTTPSEIPDAIPFEHDHMHKTYNKAHANALHRVLLSSNKVFTDFRAKFNGKASPVHFFWGSFDLAVSRFSGREAPKHPGGIPNLPDRVAQEAYSHEVSSCGFWPGNDMLPYAAFYAYVYPEPDGYKDATVQPAEAFYHPDLREFILPYSAVQEASNPEETLMSFLDSTYSACKQRVPEFR